MTFSPFQSDANVVTIPLAARVGEEFLTSSLSRSILFVDRAVSNYQSLSQPGVEIKILDSSQDAITQITQTLSGRSGIESIQILSHGASGGLYLGQDFLDATKLSSATQQIQSWKQALTANADILLYGCNVGLGAIGQSFIQSLSQLTGADVAASDDLTGQGGDWNLEVSTGTIEATIALNAIGMANYQSSLNMPVWAKSAGGSRVSDNDSGNAIAIDSAGNTYITGKLQGSNIAFGSTTVTTQDLSPDAFVTKLDASGNFLWTKTFGGTGSNIPTVALDSGQGITVDNAGNVYVIGSFQGTLNLGNSSSLTSNGVLDVFVLKLNASNGTVTWGKSFGSAGIEQGFAISLDSSNNAYITGTFGDTSFASQGGVSSDASFGSFTLTRTGITDAFVAKLDGATGNVAWAKNYGGSGSDTGFGVAATATGVYVTGNTERSGDLNVFAVKLDSSNGNTIWDKNFGGASEDTGKAICVDSSGNAYLTGYLKSATATFGSIGLQSNTINMFAAKLNGLDGSVAWAKSFGEPPSLPIPLGVSSEQYANGIGLDGSGNVYLTGSFGNTFLNGFVVLKLNGSSGALLWDRSFGGGQFESAYGLAVDSAGNSYITGEFYSEALILGNQTLFTAGGSNFFVTKLDALDPIDNEATGNLAVTGTAIEGGSLTANLINVVDADGSTTTAYRWQILNGSTWANIAGSNAALFNIASNQSMVGKQVRVIATTTDTQSGTTEFISGGQTIATIVPNSSPLDLVFYDPNRGQVSFAFVGNSYSIVNEALTGDTPVLTNNANSGTPQFSSDWRMVSASVDVDKDGNKDIIVANKFDNSVVVFFGEARTGTSRQFAYTRAAQVSDSAGKPFIPGADWTLAFASNKIGVNDSPGLFWQNKNGSTVIWSLTATTTGGVTNLGITGTAVFGLGPDSGWKASGDGEFNSSIATREVFWRNDKTSQMVTWSLTGARTLASAKLTWTNLLPTSTFNVVGIGNVSGTGVNDNIIWQTGNSIVVWNMADGVYSPTGTGVITLTAADRIKAIADVDGDGVLDLIGQFDGNGTIAAYTLTSTYGLKNTAAPRTQYFSNNPAGYRPAKGGLNGSNLELVSVAQYGA